MRGRETIKKAIVAIAAEVDGRKIGRIRLRWVPDLSAPVLRGFVKDSIAPASTVHTDGWPSYQGLAKLGFRHTVTNLSTSGDPAHVLMSAVHRVASLLKRWVLGTLQGGIAREHLPYYLDEFTFRFNLIDLPPRVVPHPMLVPAPVEGREGRASSGTRATA